MRERRSLPEPVRVEPGPAPSADGSAARGALCEVEELDRQLNQLARRAAGEDREAASGPAPSRQEELAAALEEVRRLLSDELVRTR